MMYGVVIVFDQKAALLRQFWRLGAKATILQRQ
jgi:hypothetical protein